MNSLRTYFRYHFIDYADVSEGASGHNEVVTSPRPVSVEIFLFNTFLLEETGSR
jgi:hypothetical protein